MIDTEKDNRKLVERAILVGIQNSDETTGEAKEHIQELEELVANLNIPVVDRIIVKMKMPQPKFLIGSGKVEEILQQIQDLQADCLVFDGELSPPQQRNWEKFTKICVIDRQEVILDIFAQRAITREAVLQVKLARNAVFFAEIGTGLDSFIKTAWWCKRNPWVRVKSRLRRIAGW